MSRLEALYGRLLAGLALVACALLFFMMATICADVLLRNLPGSRLAVSWANEASENVVYLIALLTAPWLLRHGRHVRVDIVLRVIPRRAAWICEWLSDFLALAGSALVFVYSARAAWASYQAGSLTIRTLITPEWRWLAPLPAAFALIVIELGFRMRRLWLGERGPRGDAVTAG